MTEASQNYYIRVLYPVKMTPKCFFTDYNTLNNNHEYKHKQACFCNSTNIFAGLNIKTPQEVKI